MAVCVSACVCVYVSLYHIFVWLFVCVIFMAVFMSDMCGYGSSNSRRRRLHVVYLCCCYRQQQRQRQQLTANGSMWHVGVCIVAVIVSLPAESHLMAPWFFHYATNIPKKLLARG